MGGFGYKTLWHIQGKEKLKFFLLHYRRNETTGKVIRASLRWTQLELGLPGQIFQHNHNEFSPYATATWCTHLWEYLWTCKSELSDIYPWIYNSPREHDFYIMEKIYSSTLSLDYKKTFNEIRLFMQVLTASDIVEVGSNNSILQNVYDGIKSRQSNWKWPCKIPFHKSWFNVWRQGLTQIILPCIRHTPLGKWIGLSHQQFMSYTDVKGQHLVSNGHTWRISSAGHRPKYTKIDYTVLCDVPVDTVPYHNLMGVCVVVWTNTYPSVPF